MFLKEFGGDEAYGSMETSPTSETAGSESMLPTRKADTARATSRKTPLHQVRKETVFKMPRKGSFTGVPLSIACVYRRVMSRGRIAQLVEHLSTFP